MNARDNNTPVRPPTDYFDFDVFDALPFSLRRLLNYAPYNFGCGHLREMLDEGVAVPEILRLARQSIRELVVAASFDAYGPSHPQASFQ